MKVTPGTGLIESSTCRSRRDHFDGVPRAKNWAVVDDSAPHLDVANAARRGREVQGVNVDFPVDLLRAIDREAKRIGVTRQAFIKLRLADTITTSR